MSWTWSDVHSRSLSFLSFYLIDRILTFEDFVILLLDQLNVDSASWINLCRAFDMRAKRTRPVRADTSMLCSTRYELSKIKSWRYQQDLKWPKSTIPKKRRLIERISSACTNLKWISIINRPESILIIAHDWHEFISCYFFIWFPCAFIINGTVRIRTLSNRIRCMIEFVNICCENVNNSSNGTNDTRNGKTTSL